MISVHLIRIKSQLIALNQVIASHLLVGPLREEDGGVYRCRVDFREAPTRNTRIKLNLISKLE